MKKNIKLLLLALIVSFGLASNVLASGDITVTVRDGSSVIYTGAVPSQPTNTVLSILNDADTLSPDFSLSNVQTYSFGSYLKCITSTLNGEKCDNWQYTVNGTYPSSSIDQHPLSGGESVYVYFGPQSKIMLSAHSVTTADTLTVDVQKYDYQNDSWVAETGVTIGLIQPGSWPVVEVKTSPVDGSGRASFSTIPAGSYDVGIQPGYFPVEALSVTEAPRSSSASAGTPALSSTSTPAPEQKSKPVFDTKKALDFLTLAQKEDGSFGEDLYTDWVTIALAGGSYQGQVLKLVKYYSGSKISGTMLTDYERRAMALMTLGLNPYNSNGENYIKKIVDSFDGKQFGDANEDNDDVFALIVLQNAGYTESDKMIQEALAFVLGRQKQNGSWDESVDMTGATIQALSPFSPKLNLGESLKKAREYLKEKQENDGGWGNVSSTAWAIQGTLALGEKPEDWKKGENSPLDYLASIQDIDGGIKDENIKNKIWKTAYVASALSGKTWSQTMQKFEKQLIAETPEIKEQKEMTKVEVKKEVVVKTNPSPKKPQLATLTKENSATAINAITESPVSTPEPKERGWFMRLLSNIFGF